MSWDLVADIGGTHMRVARVVDQVVAQRWDFETTPGGHASKILGDVVRRCEGIPRCVVAAGAGPVVDRAIRLTNGGFIVSERDIETETGAQHAYVINDFEAAAWALSSLSDQDVTPIGASGPLSPGARVAVGPGTGLGVGALLVDGGAAFALAGEGGHVAIGPRDANEIPVFESVCALWPEVQIGSGCLVEAEAILSGTGLPVLYRACGGDPGIAGKEIFERAHKGEAAASRCRSIFLAHLANHVGNLAVTFKSVGGVFLLGGVARANAHLFDDDFWRMFCEGGRQPFTDLRRRCGLYLVLSDDVGLRGCMAAIPHLLGRRTLVST